MGFVYMHYVQVYVFMLKQTFQYYSIFVKILAVFVTYYSQGIIASGLLCITKCFSMNISVIH